MRTIIAIIITVFVIIFSSQAQDPYREINRARVRHFRMPIKRDTALEKQATEWLQNMQAKYRGSLMHGSIRRKAKFEVLTTSDHPIDAWMNSKSHRKALLSRRVRGIGIVQVNGVYCARLK